MVRRELSGLLLLVCLLITLPGAGCGRRRQSAPPRVEAASAPAPASSTKDASWLDNYSAASTAVARAIMPTVAFVRVEQAAGGVQGLIPGLGTSLAEGSAVVIDPAGYLLTNNHVVQGGSNIRVSLPSGESYAGTVVGADSVRDLAVIRITPKRSLRAATFGDARTVEPGAWVMACGYPFGSAFEASLRFTPSATVGIVSATGREVQSDIPGQAQRGLIQTDAAINPGNSGGPLVDSHSRVIGINQAIFTTSQAGGNIGVGFAIPMDVRAKAIIARLRAGQPIIRGQIGVLVVTVTPELARQVKADHGALVLRVQQGGPAARAGIQTGDVIVEYNGRRVNSADELTPLVHDTTPGTTVPVRVVRNGKTLTVRVKVGKLS